MSAAQSRPMLGILAGGVGRRMGGRDKALLLAPGGDETLLARLLRLGDELGLQCVVAGGAARAGSEVLPDQPSGVGPAGGLCALLAYAKQQPLLALACDLPYVTAELIERLSQASSRAAAVAARDPHTGKWQPWFARYDSARVLPVLRDAITKGERSLQPLLRRLKVEELRLSDAEHALLRDWDEPADLTR